MFSFLGLGEALTTTMRHLLSNLLLLVLPVIAQCVDYGGPESDVQRFKDRSDFRNRVINSDSIWIVQFYDPVSFPLVS